MGRNFESFEVYASLSSHNSQQDIDDEQAWEEFKEQVQELARQPRFTDIRLDVV